MNFIERKKRLGYLLEMIEKGRCISVRKAAEKFNCSDSTVKRMIVTLREEGHVIEYCKNSKKILNKSSGGQKMTS
jgi:predicted DNA-binding transcriptional regulator YafY